MTYVVAEPCVGTKDRACVEVCPVDCFYDNKNKELKLDKKSANHYWLLDNRYIGR